MKKLSKKERETIIRFNRKNGNIIDSIINETEFTHTSGGGEKIERLPTMDEQEGTFNSDDR